MKIPLRLVFHSSLSRSTMHNTGTAPGFVHEISFMKANWIELPYARIIIQEFAGHDYSIWQWNIKITKQVSCFIEAEEGCILFIQPVEANEAILKVGEGRLNIFPRMYTFLYLPPGMHPFIMSKPDLFLIFIQPPLSFLTGLRPEIKGMEEMMHASLKQQQQLVCLPIVPMLEDNWMRLKRIDVPALKKGIPDLLLRKYMIDVLHDYGKQIKDQPHSELMYYSAKQKAILLKQHILDELMDDSLGTLEDIAKKFYTDPRALTRSFQQLTGKTILQFILDERMNLAQQLVLDTTIAIKEIVFRCGFNDASHFIRSYRKRFGNTPGRMRKNKQ